MTIVQGLNSHPGVDDETTVGDVDVDDDTDSASDGADDSQRAVRQKGTHKWLRILAIGVLPTVALLLGLLCGFLKWQLSAADAVQDARTSSVQAATDGSVALLSYNPDTVETDLNAARDRLTGDFRNSYDTLIHDVVIPGAREKRIASTANVAARGSDSVSATRAQVLVFINQTVTVGDGAPTETASSVKVSLDRIDGRWLISGFDPV